MTGQPAGGDGQSGGGEQAQQAEAPLNVVREGEGAEEVLDDDVGEEDADEAGDQAEDGELDREDAGDAGAGGSEGFEYDDFADAAVAGAGDRRGKDDDAREDGERGEELDDVDDLDDDGTDGLESLGDVDDGDGGEAGVEGSLEEADLRRVGVDATVPDDGKAGEGGLGKDELGAAVGVLTVGFGEGGDGGVELLILCGETDDGAEMEVEALGGALGDGNEGVVGRCGGLSGRPPFARDERGAGGRSLRVGRFMDWSMR